MHHCSSLRVIPLSLIPSCVTRKKTARKNGRADSWGREACSSCPQDLALLFFPRGLFSLDGQSERGTTRSLPYLKLADNYAKGLPWLLLIKTITTVTVWSEPLLFV